MRNSGPSPGRTAGASAHRPFPAPPAARPGCQQLLGVGTSGRVPGIRWASAWPQASVNPAPWRRSRTRYRPVSPRDESGRPFWSPAILRAPPDHESTLNFGGPDGPARSVLVSGPGLGGEAAPSPGRRAAIPGAANYGRLRPGRPRCHAGPRRSGCAATIPGTGPAPGTRRIRPAPGPLQRVPAQAWRRGETHSSGSRVVPRTPPGGWPRSSAVPRQSVRPGGAHTRWGRDGHDVPPLPSRPTAIWAGIATALDASWPSGLSGTSSRWVVPAVLCPPSRARCARHPWPRAHTTGRSGDAPLAVPGQHRSSRQVPKPTDPNNRRFRDGTASGPPERAQYNPGQPVP